MADERNNRTGPGTTFVILGASGDLTSRKLVPALYGIFRKGQLAPPLTVVGVSRTEFSHAAWRAALAETTAKFVGSAFDAESWNRFAEHIFYVPGDIEQPEDFRRLAQFLDKQESGTETTRVYYLATLPTLYGRAIEHLGQAELADQSRGRRHVVIEKPFGVDLESARELNRQVHRVFDESQVFRIDHYLGKETVQNLLVLRFANSIFEPLWNRNYVDHVQITVAEEGLVGRRGAYYESAGVLRDMFQAHLLQLLMITAMEAPVRYEAQWIRDEKVKVLQAIRRWTDTEIRLGSLRGQYEGYRREPHVAPDSRCATFAVLRLWIDNWRWQGVPFYLRSGKAMSCRTTQIVVQFRCPPHMLFPEAQGRGLEANRLVIQIQPAEGIQLHFLTKVPDAGMRLRMTDLDFRFRREFPEQIPDAYERLLVDAAVGDASLFARNDEVELCWKIIDPVIQAWHDGDGPELQFYEPGQWGPAASVDWMRSQGREWFDVCPVLC